MVIEMVFFNEIQVFQFSLHFLKYIYIVVYIIEKKLKLNFKSCHLDKISIIYQISKMMFCVMF